MLIPNNAVGQSDVSCYQGTCTGRNECTCHDGWNGTRCNRGKSHPYMEILPIAMHSGVCGTESDNSESTFVAI